MPQLARSEGRQCTGADRKADVIQIRTSARTKAILNRAAALLGQNFSEFVLELARRHAEETMLDQRVFFLQPKEHERFLAQLNSPDRPSDEVRARLTRKAPWAR